MCDPHFHFRVDIDSNGLSDQAFINPMYRSISLPDRLDGEAAFLEDSLHVANKIHRQSLAYVDLLNDDDGARACLVNGHVMLLDNKQIKLLHQIEGDREQFGDLIYTVRQGRKMKRKIIVSKRNEITTEASRRDLSEPSFSSRSGMKEDRKLEDRKLERRKYVGNRICKLLHINQNDNIAEHQHHSIDNIRKADKPRKRRDFFHRQEEEWGHVPVNNICGNTKTDPSSHDKTGVDLGSLDEVCDEVCQRGRHTVSCNNQESSFESIGYIDPVDIANELTLIDREMLLRLHEAELADCAWRKKEEKEIHARNVLAILDIFIRIVGLLASEILQEFSVDVRMERIVNIIDIAYECKMLKNFHSLRTCLAALQIIPIYRLHETWRNLEDHYSDKFRILRELQHFSGAADGHMSFRQAMHIAKDSPPCIPFIGTFLQDIIASEFDFDETVIDANIKGKNSSTESFNKQPHLGFDVAEEPSNSTNNEIGNYLIEHSSMKENFLYSFASAWRALRPSFTHETGKIIESDAAMKYQSHTEKSSICKPTPITNERRRHIQKLILAYARKLGAEDNEQNAKVNSVSMDEDCVDWKKLFDFVRIQKNNTNVTQLPSSCESSVYGGSEKADNAIRDQVNRTLFLFQSAAVQYGIHSRPTVRKYLLTKSYVSGDELYKQSRLLEEP